MIHSVGKIEPIWKLTEIEALPYFFEEFNDNQTLATWNQIYENLSFGTGYQADYRTQQPTWTKDVLKLLEKDKIFLKNVGTSYYKMNPGNILPYHQDQYVSYCRYHSTTIECLRRVVVFLQDWQPGFVFELDGKPIVEYQAGTYVTWTGEVPHMVANLGKVPRYSLQITGIINDTI